MIILLVGFVFHRLSRLIAPWIKAIKNKNIAETTIAASKAGTAAAMLMETNMDTKI